MVRKQAPVGISRQAFSFLKWCGAQLDISQLASNINIYPCTCRTSGDRGAESHGTYHLATLVGRAAGCFLRMEATEQSGLFNLVVQREFSGCLDVMLAHEE